MKLHMFRKAAAVFVISLGSVLLSGCFDIREVDDMNIVLAMGIDQVDDDSVRVTAQLINPATVPSAGGGESSLGAATRAFIVRQETGSSIEEALDKFDRDLPHSIYMAHNTLVVFGEAYAKRGIDRALDYFERNRYFRRNQLFVVTSGIARDVLSASSDPEPLTALGIRALVEQAGEKFRLANSEQQQVMKEYLSPSQAPILALIDLNPADHPVMKGVAVFRGSKLAHEYTLDETVALAWLLGGTRQVEIHLPCDGRGDDVGTSVRVLGSSTQVVPQVEKKGMGFLVTVRVEAEIERLCPYERMSEKTYKQLEKKTAKYMEREIRAVVKQLQADGVDACQFGTKVFTRDPQLWGRISRIWPEVFATAQVECNVRVQIVRTGLSAGTPESAASPSGVAPTAGRRASLP
ncbi:MAG: Ger(x)C family spore germination protein [Alicyclobacillus sp.]|nr:Ger(x)C family spore germination protein [Alicyclobacillus sp.]